VGPPPQCPNWAVPSEINSYKDLILTTALDPGHQAADFQIAIEKSAFIDTVRLLEVSHFDRAISKWGMTSKCR
jgi:hypothetical protein